MARISAILLRKNISTLSSKDACQKQALQGSILAVAAAAAVIVSAPPPKLPSHITRTRAIDRQIQEDYGYIMRVYKGIFKCKSKRLFETQNSTKNWKNYAKVYIRESRDRYENECGGWYLSR